MYTTSFYLPVKICPECHGTVLRIDSMHYYCHDCKARLNVIGDTRVETSLMVEVRTQQEYMDWIKARMHNQ